MKKSLLAVGVAVFALASCTTTTKTATAVDVAHVMSEQTQVEMEVSPTRITYNFRPAARERRGGKQNVINTAVREALRSNGGGDVLVSMEYDLRERKGLFGKKIKEVTVYGYPAKYTKFTKK